MNTKTQKAIELYRNGCVKEALSIFRTFKIGFTKEQRRVLQIASECLAGNSLFYSNIGIDTSKCIEDSKSIINNKYFSHE